MSEKYEKIYSANAERGTKYGGRRFLGITPEGKEVWSTMEFDRSSKILDLNLGKGFKVLYDEQKENDNNFYNHNDYRFRSAI